MDIPNRLLEDAFWELENELNEEVWDECKNIASTNTQARQLYIRVRAMHFMLIEKKHRIDEARKIVETEQLWDEMKSEKKSNK